MVLAIVCVLDHARDFYAIVLGLDDDREIVASGLTVFILVVSGLNDELNLLSNCHVLE